jgi:hypothetical protein
VTDALCGYSLHGHSSHEQDVSHGMPDPRSPARAHDREAPTSRSHPPRRPLTGCGSSSAESSACACRRWASAGCYADLACRPSGRFGHGHDERYPSRRTLPCWPGSRMTGPLTRGVAGGGVFGLWQVGCTQLVISRTQTCWSQVRWCPLVSVMASSGGTDTARTDPIAPLARYCRRGVGNVSQQSVCAGCRSGG